MPVTAYNIFLLRKSPEALVLTVLFHGILMRPGIQTIRVTHMPFGHSDSARHTDAMVIQMPRSLICPTVIQTLPGTHMQPGMLMTKVHNEHWQAL